MRFNRRYVPENNSLSSIGLLRYLDHGELHVYVRLNRQIELKLVTPCRLETSTYRLTILDKAEQRLGIAYSTHEYH